MSSSTPTPTALFVVFFLWLNGLSRHNWCAILLNDLMNLHMSSLDTFVSERPWCVFYSTRSQFYWGLTHVVFHWNSDLISHTQTHTNTHTKTHSTFGASRLTSPYKYIFTPTVIYSEQLFTFHNVFFFSKIIPGNNPEKISVPKSDASLPPDFLLKLYFDKTMPKMVSK